MRPIDRGDMQAWLGVLQTQLSAQTQRANRGALVGSGVNGAALVTTLHEGWLEKRGEHVAVGMVGGGWKRRFFVLSARQEQTGDEIELRHFLHYFKSEEQAAHVVVGRHWSLPMASCEQGLGSTHAQASWLPSTTSTRLCEAGAESA